MPYLFIGTTVTILLLTACGPAATLETVPTLPPAATPTTNPAQTTFDSPLPSGVAPLPQTAEPPTPVELEDTGKGRAAIGDAVIIYERSGGIAGIMQTYEIYADGRTVIRDGDTEIETRVSPNDVQTALTRIEELGFFDLAAPLGPIPVNEIHTYAETINYQALGVVFCAISYLQGRFSVRKGS